MTAKGTARVSTARVLCTLWACALWAGSLWACGGRPVDELPRGLLLQAWPLRLEVGGTARVSANFRDRSPSLPAMDWITDHGSILKGRVANEVVFQAPREPRSCTLSVEVRIEDRVFKDSVFFTVTLPGGFVPGLDPAGKTGSSLSQAAADPSALFSDRSPLYASPLWPGPRDALNLKLRVKAALEGEAWIHIAPEGRPARRRPMALLGSDGDFRWYGAQIQGSEAPAAYWFEFSNGRESVYCSLRGAEAYEPPPSRLFRLLPPSSSALPLPESAGGEMARAILGFLEDRDRPALRADGRALSASLVAASADIPQNRLLEPLNALSASSLSSLLPRPDSSSEAEALRESALTLSALLPGGLRERDLEGATAREALLLGRLAELRKALSSLRRGSWLCMPPPDGGSFAMARWDGASRVLFICRREGQGLLTIPVDALGLGEGQRLKAVLGSSPGTELLEGQQYQVRAGSITLGWEGPAALVLVAQGLEEPSPAPPVKPRLTSILPADGAKMIPVDSRIAIQFSHAMDQADIARVFSMSPPAEGIFIWNGRTCTFVPTQSLESSTRYGISIDGTYGSRLGGYRLEESLSFSFNTR